MLRAARRLAAAAASKANVTSASKQEVPDVLVSFGNQADRITFVSHPGVMAVSKLLEMSHVTQHRAVLTQADVDAIAEHDPELSRKAQIAVDEKLAVNFQDLQYFDRPEFVAAFKKEQQLLQEARAEVLKAPKGQYNMPKSLKDYKLPMLFFDLALQAPRNWRPEMVIPPEALEADPKLRMKEELSSLVRKHLEKTQPAGQLRE
ncbi:hypothetical protein Efla_006086 [Eimeria flavescens]